MLREPEALDFTRTILEADEATIPVPTLLEASVVLARLGGERAVEELDRFVALTKVVPVAFGPEHLGFARRAYRLYGKGSGHPAGLNYGDCFAYALAKSLEAPLLFKGADFDKTDVAIVRAAPP